MGGGDAGPPPRPQLLERDVTVFRHDQNGWRRSDEDRNTTFEPERARQILRRHGIEAEERASFGEERPLDGLVALVGRRGD